MLVLAVLGWSLALVMMMRIAALESRIENMRSTSRRFGWNIDLLEKIPGHAPDTSPWKRN